jgi:hypothetical protein
VNVLSASSFRLVPRGRAGLACDDDGVALGPVNLVELFRDGDGGLRFRMRPVAEVSEALKLAYGDRLGTLLARRRRSLAHIAELLTAGEGARAKMHAVLLGFPDIADEGMARLCRLADSRSGEVRNEQRAGGVVATGKPDPRRPVLHQDRRSLMRDRFRSRDSDPRQSLLRERSS